MKSSKGVITACCLFIFFSGLTSLLFQIIWTRMLLLVFGVTTLSVVAVISGFMAGLGVGSLVLGKIGDKTNSPLRLYGFLEILVGAGALVTTFSINQLFLVYRNFSDPQLVLIIKFLASFAVLFLPTFFMGGTVPFVVKFLKIRLASSVDNWLSRIYAVNTFGAFIGTLVSAYFLIEVLGLSAVAMVGTGINFAIGVAAIWIDKSSRGSPSPAPSRRMADLATRGKETEMISYAKRGTFLIFFAVAGSGFLSMAYEVLWTRLLISITDTYIYSFAQILALILLGIALGSLLYNRLLVDIKLVMFLLGTLQIGIGLGAFFSIFFISTFYPGVAILLMSLTIFPAAIFMGMSFPVASKLIQNIRATSKSVGNLYFVNLLGSVLGPVAAAFFLIPVFGVGRSIVLLASINCLVGVALIYFEERSGPTNIRAKAAVALLVLFLGIGLFDKLRPDYFYPKALKHKIGQLKIDGYDFRFTEDNTASVLAYRRSDDHDSGLMIDGVPTTILVGETKLMAHLPLLLHKQPQKILVVAFGMGTTFRSALSHGVTTHAVDLVPSVPKMVSYFHPDSRTFLSDPKGKIFIEDGRNFVRTTREKYDVITVDPPPPVNSAGTTVLYSKEFYEQGGQLLNNGGLFSEWLSYGTRVDDFKMLVKSFVTSFPNAYAFASPNKLGLFLIGSYHPISLDWDRVSQKLENLRINKDLNEWDQWDSKRLSDLYLGDRQFLLDFANDSPEVSDNYPRTEYFWLRNQFSTSPIMDDELIQKVRSVRK